MKRKAEISMQVLVMAIISLVVLAVVIFIFYDQIKDVASGFSKAREDAQFCETGLLGGQECMTSCPSGWELVNAKCDGGLVCCKRA